MGWAISIALVVVGLINHDSIMLSAAGIFAVAGSIGILANAMKN